MDYRRKALLRSKQAASSPSPDNRLDRVVAISSIVSNIVIGVATVVLAGIGIYLTSEFNQWQKEDSEQAQQQVAYDGCISTAQLIFDAIKFRPEKDAANLIQSAVSSRSDCAQYGVNIPNLVATMVLEDTTNIDPKIVQRAIKRVAIASNMPGQKRAAAATPIDLFKRNFDLQQRVVPHVFPSVEVVNFAGFDDDNDTTKTNAAKNDTRVRVDLTEYGECNAKLDDLIKAKPNEPSWSVKCDDGTTKTRNAF
jgi:hypothetical protein